MHNCIRTLNLIFGLLAQVASRPSVQLNSSLFHCSIRCIPIPLFSLLYYKAILLLLLSLHDQAFLPDCLQIRSRSLLLLNLSLPLELLRSLHDAAHVIQDMLVLFIHLHDVFVTEVNCWAYD